MTDFPDPLVGKETSGTVPEGIVPEKRVLRRFYSREALDQIIERLELGQERLQLVQP